MVTNIFSATLFEIKTLFLESISISIDLSNSIISNTFILDPIWIFILFKLTPKYKNNSLSDQGPLDEYFLFVNVGENKCFYLKKH